jgi:hypothetical protein
MGKKKESNEELQTKIVKFLRPAAGEPWFLAYSEGDVVTLEAKTADELIENKIAVLFEQEAPEKTEE